MAVSKQLLSGSTNGKGIKVTAASTPGTTIHACHATASDEVWVWAFNSAGSSELVTVEFGGTTDPDNIIEVSVPPTGAIPTLLIPGLVGTGSITIAAFADDANVVVLYGFVNRIV